MKQTYGQISGAPIGNRLVQALKPGMLVGTFMYLVSMGALGTFQAIWIGFLAGATAFLWKVMGRG
ncbi:hypothetical protein [Fulvitalea axinellae]